MPSASDRKPPAVARHLYPWADLVIDLAAGRRKVLLGETLPPPLRTYTGTVTTHLVRPDGTTFGPVEPTGTVSTAGADGAGSVTVHRVTDPRWSTPNRANIVIVTTLPTTLPTSKRTSQQQGQQQGLLRTALVVDQSAGTPGASSAAIGGTMPPCQTAYLFGRPDRADRFEDAPRRAQESDAFRSAQMIDWYRHLANLTSWLTSGPLAGETSTWSATKTRTWLQWFGAGITTAEHRATLEAVGVGKPRRLSVGTVGHLLGKGVTFDEVLAWATHLSQVPTRSYETAGLVLTAHHLRLSFADLTAYLGTSLDPLVPGLGLDGPRKRMEQIRAAIDEGWTPDGRAAISASAPPGCEPDTWAQVWASFMPIRLASAYAAAGFTLVEAAARHHRGEDLDPQTLATLAGLRRQPT